MKCSVHQPHFFPWLGYMAKIASSDVFVVLDDVQFTRRNFQNRCKIISSNGAENWLTVPLTPAPQSQRIHEMKISTHGDLKNFLHKMDAVYKKSAYYPLYRAEIAEILLQPHENLMALTLQTMKWLLQVFKIPMGLSYRSSALKLARDIDPNQRIIEICRYHGANQYIAGSGGKNYMQLSMFEEAGIEILWQDFKHQPIKYPSIDGQVHFGLSSLDALFALGPHETRTLIYQHVMG